MPVGRMLMAILLSFFMMLNPLYAQGPKGGHGKEIEIEAHKAVKHKHVKVPEVKLKIKKEICQSPCKVIAEFSLHSKHRNKHHDEPVLVGYAIDWGDGSPIEIVTTETAVHEYSYLVDKELPKKKGKGHHLGILKKKDFVKVFKPTVTAIFENNVKSKPDREKVRVIAEYRESPPENMAPVAKLTVTPNEGLAPLQVTLDASGSSDDKGIVLYTFIVGNGEIISTTEPVLNVVYSSAGVFSPQVVVSDQENLEDSVSASVSVSAPPVNQAPIASLSATPILGDAPLLVTFDSSASSDDKAIVNRIYLFGDGQSLTTTDAVVSHLYQQSGNYSASVQIFDQENLSNTKSVSIEVNTPNTAPIASLSVDKVRANPGASFKFDGSTSTDAENNIVSFTLANSVLGINQTNTTGIFDVVINQSGSFNFILEVIDSMNLKSTASISVSVNAPPIALLSADKISGEAPLTVTFDSSASSDDVGIIKRDYQFAPNVFALNAGSSVGYTYNEVGVYPVKVKIYDGENLVSEAMVEITVTAPEIKTPPIAWFLIEINPDTYEVRLLNKAERGSSNIKTVSYELNGSFLANGTTYPYSEVSFQGEFGQVYQVRQIVTDEQNQTDDQIFNIVLDPSLMRPISNFKVAQSNVREVFLGAIRSFDPFDQITSIQVNWGDNTPTETLDSFFSTHQYAIAGTYSITLRVESANGLFAERTKQITVTDEAVAPLSPIANFRAESDDRVKHVRLYSQFSGTANGQILSYFWQYGDGQVGYGEQSVHFYTPGIYLASLTITDSMNFRATQVQQIIVTEDGPPVVTILDCDTFGMYAGCDFFAAHKDKQLDRVEIDWKDGSPIESFPVDNNEWQIFPETGHIYQAAGVYDISIRAVTFTGLESIATHPVLIQETSGNQAPIANLSCFVLDYTHIHCDTSGSFDPDGFITNYHIDMGDGTVYNQSYQIIHTFQTNGTYTISMTLTDNFGAQSTAQQTLTVFEYQNQAPVANLNCYSSGLNQLSCDSAFSSDFDGFITSAEYKFDDGSSIIKNSNVEAVVKDFETGGQKFIEVIVTDNEGAQGSASGTFFVPNDNPPSGDFYCNSYETLKLDCGLSSADDDAGTPSVQFEFIQGQATSLPNSYTYASNGDKAVRMILTDSRNQQTIIEKTFAIISNQAPIAKITSDKLAVVAPGIIHLSSTESSDPENHAITKLWTLPDGSTRAGDEFDLNIDVISKVSVTLVVIDSYGFSNSATLNLAGKSDFTNIIILSKSSTQVPSTFTMSPTLVEDEFGDPLTFEWWINGQKKSTNANYSETILDPGAIEIKLVSIDIYGDRYETIQSETLETHPLYFALNRYEGYAAQGESVEFQIGNLVTDSPDYQINITSTDPNAIIELVNNNAFTIQSNIVGSPVEITVTATDGIDSFERKANVEFVQMQEIFNSTVSSTPTNISYNGADLALISTPLSKNVIARIGQFNEKLLLEFSTLEEKAFPLSISNLNSNKDYLALDLETSNASTSGANFNRVNYNLTNFESSESFSPCINDQDSKKVVITDNGSTTDVLFETQLLNHSILVHHSLAGNLIDQNGDLLQSTQTYKSLEKILSNTVLSSKIFITNDSDYSKRFGGKDSPGVVVRGIERINIKSSTLSGTPSINQFSILTHENHHIEQNRDCEYLQGLKSFQSQSALAIKESNADLAALRKVFNLSSNIYSDYVTYPRLRLSNVNESFKDFIANGLDLSKKYNNETYFELLGVAVDEYSFVSDRISFGYQNLNLLEEYGASGFNFQNTAAIFLNDMSSISSNYNRIGLSLPEAALEAVKRDAPYDVGPYGFGYLKIPKNVIQSGLMSGDIFRLEVEHGSTVSFEHLSTLTTQNGIARSSFMNLTSPKYESTNKSVLEFNIQTNNGIVENDGYFSIINYSIAQDHFQILKTEGICDPNNEFEFYGSTSKTCYQCDTSNPARHHYPDVEQCLICDQSLGYKIHDPGTGEQKKCIYCPTGSLRSDGTCDWPAPIIGSEPGEIIAGPSGDCPRLDYGTNIVYTGCSYAVTCQGGTLSPTSSNNIYWASGRKYECIPYYDGTVLNGHPRGSWKADSTYDPGSLIVSCSNSDVIKDTVSITLTCDQ